MNDYYDYLPLEEYEAELATRKYWDDAGAEWKMSSIETKLLLLATFVRRGGKLNRGINSYAKGRERTYRVTIQHCVMSYIAKLMGSNDYFLRIILLSKREVIELLTELLKANVMIESYNNYHYKQYPDECTIKCINKNDDSILVDIEKRHIQAYPDETIQQKRRRVNKWISGCLW